MNEKWVKVTVFENGALMNEYSDGLKIWETVGILRTASNYIEGVQQAANTAANAADVIEFADKLTLIRAKLEEED